MPANPFEPPKEVNERYEAVPTGGWGLGWLGVILLLAVPIVIYATIIAATQACSRNLSGGR